MSGCLPTGRGQMGRLSCAVLETKLTQTSVNSWEKHPSLCFVKVIKITPGRPLAVGYALNGSVFPGRQGH